MSLDSPNLDDRQFDDLVNEARRMITNHCPDWTDLSPGDPGMMMVELFAHLTEVMIYRLNRLPDKAYIEFLRLIGVILQPPFAASVDLQFSLVRPQNKVVIIPRSTRVAAARGNHDGEPPVFITTVQASIAVGETMTMVHALHCELVQGELVGHGNDLPGLCVQALRSPLIQPSGDDLDLVVGVEVQPEELEVNTAAIHFNDKVFRIWTESDNFSELHNDRYVYTVDRFSGKVMFAPAVRLRKDQNGSLSDVPTALAEIPTADREIRLWYRRGGGLEGNVTANTLSVLKSNLASIVVNNPSAAIGGRDAEKLDNAMLRGPHELHSLQRAVTARDFELLAVRSSGAVNRAMVYASATQWAHAKPGTVEVVLVPEITEKIRLEGKINQATLREHESVLERENILKTIDERRPLGVMCQVNWVRYKPVSIEARVVVRREEDPDAVEKRLLNRLYNTISPLSVVGSSVGWPFGKSFKAWDVYKLIGTEPGVVTVEDVRLLIDDAPEDQVSCVTADNYQANTWYAAKGPTLFRSMNNGNGWEALVDFPGEEIEKIVAYPSPESGAGHPGLLAISNKILDTNGSHVHISHDCGETWQPLRLINDYHIDDMAWIDRNGLLSLLWATDNGLYEHTLAEAAVPQKIIVSSNDQDLGFYSVTVSLSSVSGTYVAAASRQQGIFLSSQGGDTGTYNNIGLKNELVPVLAIQQLGPHRHLWAGLGARGSDKGKGCCRWLLTEINHEGWVTYSEGWQAGGCRSLAFVGSTIHAATLRLGVLNIDVAQKKPVWQASDINCGLPVADVGKLQPVQAISSDSRGDWLLAAPLDKGIYRSNDGGQSFELCSSRIFSEEVTIPDNWMLCSGQHAITVVSEDAS